MVFLCLMDIETFISRIASSYLSWLQTASLTNPVDTFLSLQHRILARNSQGICKLALRRIRLLCSPLVSVAPFCKVWIFLQKPTCFSLRLTALAGCRELLWLSYIFQNWFQKKSSLLPKNWCSWPVVLEKTLESPLDCMEIKPINPKGNQPWIFKDYSIFNIQKDWCWSWSSNTLATWCEESTHWKRPWCWERLKAKGEEDEMVGEHHQHNEHECEQAPGDSKGQGNLGCCSLCVRKELDMI